MSGTAGGWSDWVFNTQTHGFCRYTHNSNGDIIFDYPDERTEIQLAQQELARQQYGGHGSDLSYTSTSSSHSGSLRIYLPARSISAYGQAEPADEEGDAKQSAPSELEEGEYFPETNRHISGTNDGPDLEELNPCKALMLFGKC
ncbi:MAG: hypothetical protein M1820_008057 [Bogoriella megaspora]|nr:MAG: hypothetical protein M1820_008057 [Bogoriella megaspora]